MDKEYIRATIYTTTQGAEALSAVLPALGIDGFSIEDPADLDFIIASKDKLAWDFVGIEDARGAEGGGEARACFYLENTDGAEADVQEVRVALMKLKSDEQYGLYGEDADFGRLWLDTSVVRDDWKYKYKETFRTFSPCEGIVVTPPWETAAADETPSAGNDALRLIIDPGMAFGTGSHETTALCLSRLKGLLKPGYAVLDAGTGSGILAIAAALLGAARIDAVEIDEDAAASAAGNIAANNVSGRIDLLTCDITAPGTLPEGARYDLITANLSCGILKTLLPTFKTVLKEHGAMILSGLLDAQEEQTLEALENEGLRAADVVADGEWVMIEARK
ncbi:MAG: 50S ribosomal protein L11 methyltransferase [Clostridiales Family XIII bacterium]|nr:50S ribosomal protein L11 methyltransferase [Clostridiales Family XIII bacterium]